MSSAGFAVAPFISLRKIPKSRRIELVAYDQSENFFTVNLGAPATIAPTVVGLSPAAT
jgi:hypothetical protein